ncbi:MAG: autotransporter-associated beta strand repeat-containing protein, partial [Prosthecobacter sp.]|nr:autotransporter-associated beta strand repeat-containing protein [Prosthecobacter sp.]
MLPLLAASLLRADVLIWDTNIVTDGAQDGTGTWTAGSPNWFNQTQTLQNQSWLNGSDAVFGAGSGTAGTITLSGPITAGNLTFNAATSGSYTLGGSGVLTLASSTITSNVAAAINAVLAGDTAWAKQGAGQLTLGGSLSNTNTGTLALSAGRLHLAKTGGATALAGNVNISDGGSLTFAGGTNLIATTAHVTVSGVNSDFNGTAPNIDANPGGSPVIQTLASLTMNGGTFNAGANSVWNIEAVSFVAGTNRVFVGNSGSKQTFGSLSLAGMNGAASSTTVANGFTLFGNGGSLANRTTLTIGAGGLSLNGSIIRMGTGTSGSELVLNGDVTTSGASASAIEREAGTGLVAYVSLSGTAGVVSRTFDMGGGGANLTISPIIQNGAATTASVVKNGTGTLTFSGAEANTYSGDTTINAGTLRLNKTAGVTAVAGNIIVNTGGTLQLSTNNQIADTAGITINGGTMTGWATDETIAFLMQNSGGLTAGGNTGHVTITGALTLAGGSTLVINS